MKLKKIMLQISVTALAFYSQVAGAVACYEKVTAVISHSSGKIFFKTDKTCPEAWCEVSGNSDYVKQSYAMLLLANSTNRTVLFAWNNLPSCSDKNPVYSVPDFLVVEGS